MATAKTVLPLLQQKIWDGRLPLEIHLSRDESRQYNSTAPYLTTVPRLSYLPLLLPRLHRYFTPSLIVDASTISPHEGYFTFDGIPLKWYFPIGLLYDMYVLAVQDPTATSTSSASASAATEPGPGSGKDNLPLVLTLHFKPPSSNSNPTGSADAAAAAAAAATGMLINPTPLVLHDAFINSLKEADFVRSGTAKPIMSLPTSESKSLWTSTQANDLTVWAKVHGSLLPKPGQWRGIPLRIFLPVLDHDDSNDTNTTNSKANNLDEDDEDNDDNDHTHHQKGSKKPKAKSNPTAQIRVVQAHIAPTTAVATVGSRASTARLPAGANTQPQTLGSALNSLLPSLFPSRRTAVLARPILHGSPVPLSANLEDLARWCCYADGWLAVIVGVNA